MGHAVTHQSSPGLMIGLSPRQMDTLDADVLAEHAAHEARVLAEVGSGFTEVFDAPMVHTQPMSDIGAALFGFAGTMNRSLGPASSIFDSPVLRGAVTTDDTEEVATLVNQMAEVPHRFAERYLELERRFRALEAAHERMATMVQVHESYPIHLRRLDERVSNLAYREVL